MYWWEISSVSRLNEIVAANTGSNGRKLKMLMHPTCKILLNTSVTVFSFGVLAYGTELIIIINNKWFLVCTCSCGDIHTLHLCVGDRLASWLMFCIALDPALNNFSFLPSFLPSFPLPSLHFTYSLFPSLNFTCLLTYILTWVIRCISDFRQNCISYTDGHRAKAN